MYKKVSVAITMTLIMAAILTVSTALQRSYGQADEILRIHNAERAEIGNPPLTWSESLAADAQSYAQHLATLGRLLHCDEPEAGLTGAAADACKAQGENVARGSPPPVNEVKEVQFMAAEKSNIPSGFTGHSYILRPAIGHYTQMVWKNTREVGCGAAQTSDRWYFVCRYSPFGNIAGQMYK
jgi:pathogenesis-related protein 1